MAKKKAAAERTEVDDNETSSIPTPARKKATRKKGTRKGDVHEDTGDVAYVGSKTAGALLRGSLQKKLKTMAIYDGHAAVDLQLGIAMPALSARMIFSSAAYLLNKMVMIVGKKGSNKSAFMTEIQRWHYCAGGLAGLVHSENKDQPELRNGTFGHNASWIEEYNVLFPKTTEETQAAMTAHALSYREHCKLNGATRPYAVGLDSLAARGSEKTLEGITEDGHAVQGYDAAKNAGLITTYMKSFWSMVEGLPFSWVVVNHIKEKMSTSTFKLGHAPPEKTSPGGELQKYLEGVELELSASKQFQMRSGGNLFTGHTCTFSCNKNGWGPKSYPVKVDFLWWFEPDPANPGKFRQQFVWDWHTATIRIWKDLEKYLPETHKQLHEVCDIRTKVKSQSGSQKSLPAGMCWSKRLDIPETEPVTYSQASMILETKPDLLREIYAVLQIIDRPTLAPGQDYIKVLAKKQERAVVEAWQVFQEQQRVPVILGDAEVTETDVGGSEDEE